MKILVVAPSWLGDLIMSHSLYQLLKAADPHHDITLYAPRYQQPIIARIPEVAHFIENPFAHGTLALKRRFNEGRRLKQEHFDLAIVLPNSFKSALPPFFAGIALRRGFKGESRFVLLNEIYRHKENFPRMVERYAALAFSPATIHSASDLPPIPQPKLQALPPEPALLAKLQLSLERPLLALGCGANYGPAKLWPVEYFANISQRWIEHGGAILALGTPKDVPTVHAIAAQIPPKLLPYFYDIAGKTSLTEALDLAACASAAVCNDSGMMHLIAALNVPQCAIFGSTSTSYTPPLSDKAICLESDAPCHPCFARTCRYQTYRCLKDLRPEQVWTCLQRIAHA